MSFIETVAAGIRLHVRVTPRSSRDGIAGVETDASGRVRLKVRVSAPPADGAANERVIEILAKAVGAPKSAFALVAGAHHRNKVLEISGRAEDWKARLAALGEAT